MEFNNFNNARDVLALVDNILWTYVLELMLYCILIY